MQTVLGASPETATPRVWDVPVATASQIARGFHPAPFDFDVPVDPQLARDCDSCQ